MFSYPLKDIKREVWQKKISCTAMLTIPAEDEAFPVLQELNQILTRLLQLKLEQTLDESVTQYFLTVVFPTVCQNLIRSRYFKSSEVLRLSNFILEKSVYLLCKYFEYSLTHSKFLQILTSVFSEEAYFKNNNQTSYEKYPNFYFGEEKQYPEIELGSYLDVLKADSSSDKVTWSQGKVIDINQYGIEVAYLYDGSNKKSFFKQSSKQIAPHRSKSKTFEWRMSLKQGDLVDVQDSFGNWYNATVLEVIDKGQEKKSIRVTMKIYHQLGPKEDQKGAYFGFSEFEEIRDVTSPKVAPFSTVAKQFCYQSSKISSFDNVEDLNDYEFTQVNGQRIYALIRKKHLSQFLFKTINEFGKRGGFERYMEYLEKENSFDILCYFIKGVSGVSPYLHRQLAKNLAERMKTVFDRYLFDNIEKATKTMTKQRIEIIFSGLKALQKRVYSSQFVSKYENTIKMKIADYCLQSEAIKNKLLGLNQLKDIVRSVMYTSEKTKYIKKWIKNNKMFDKIYLVNSHVQLIKKSQEFFKYLINESILQVTDLQRLYKMAQKGDFQSRVSLYKLFQEVSHIFKREHVEFLIDTILQSELNLILNEDIDLLHELSKFSNYFPLQKVITFFQNIILSQNKVKQLTDYAIKRYSEIVSKNSEVKPERRNIIRNFLSKLETHNVLQVTKVLKGIFEGISTGDWEKKQLNQILSEEKVDQRVVQTIKKYSNTPQYGSVVTVLEDFLYSIFKLSYRIKINIKVIDNIWTLVEGNQSKQKEYFKWANQISKLQQGFENSTTAELEQFFRKIFTEESIPNTQRQQFELGKNLFVEINRRLKYLTVSSTYKDRELEKQYKRKVSIKQLKVIDLLLNMVYNIQDEQINNDILNFFIELYTSKSNSQAEIDQFISKLLEDFKAFYDKKNYWLLLQTIKLIGVVINDSQKNVETMINSLISKKESGKAKFIIINEYKSFSSDSSRKSDLFVPMNTQVIRLRKILAKQLNATWQQIKIVSHKEIEDYDNSRTLKQLKINPNQPLTISQRIVSTQQEQLLLNNKINPKAERCFQVIFDKYSTNGKMNKTQSYNFTYICLGPNCNQKYYQEKISYLFNKYDDDKDDFLTFPNFLQFYEDASRQKPITVWNNLKSFQVKSDFRFTYEPQELVEISRYPRNVISEQPNFYDKLFDLLHVKQIASHAFELLERLPVSKTIQEKLLNIESGADLENILSTSDLYELFYKLNIIEYLAHSSQLKTQKEKDWHRKFIDCNGYEVLYGCLKKILKKGRKTNGQQVLEQVDDITKQISQTCLNLLVQYWIQCFAGNSKKVREALELISGDQEFEDKMDYLIFGRFFKSDRKLDIRQSKIPKDKSIIWRGGDKLQITIFLLQQLIKSWEELNKIGQQSNQNKYLLSTLIGKIIQSLHVLALNENPQSFVKLIPQLLDKIPSGQLIRKLYCLILCQCYFAKDYKYQGLYIKQLFKNLTKGTITSQHFRVLAQLVSKFGIESMSNEGESQETRQKLKEVLFENIVNNNNQLTIQGCARLLSNFNLQGASYDIFIKIWQQKIFNVSTLNHKQQSKVALYQLILKICQNNPELISKVIDKVLSSLDQSRKLMKITYCNQFKQRSNTGYAGLKNLGSTCYINSMVQQLFMNKNFRYCILRADDGENPKIIEAIDNKNEVRNVDDNFLHQLQKIFAYLESTSRIDFAPRDFCVAYKPFGESVNVLIQQDVQQFVSMFFDRLQSGLSKTIFKKLVSEFYAGKITNLFKCHSCSQTKKVEENFYSISLQVKSSKTLAQSFNRFCHGEMISDFKCQFCNNRVDVTKMTRVSSAPKILIIHLQRIVFSLDTFINQKITTKHSFPNNFNLFNSSLEHYELVEKGQDVTGQNVEYNYELIGIICHSGTADSGHYISYIKTSQNKWIQFNDSLVSWFNPSNIESECFGGYFSTTTFDDEFYQDKKESSKSAYLLLYQKQGQNKIEVVLNKMLESCKTEKQRQELKNKILNQLDLKQILEKVGQQKQIQINQKNTQQVSENENTQNGTPYQTQSHQESSSAPEDSQKQTKYLLQQKQLQIKRHQSEDNIQVVQKPEQPISEQKQLKVQEKQQKLIHDTVISIQKPVSPYLSEQLKKEIEEDNQIHFFQKCFSSPPFIKFFSKLMLYVPEQLYSSTLPMCQALTFGFWLKSPSFKDLLYMLERILKIHPDGFESMITKNPGIISLLIQSMDTDIRNCMVNFLSRIIADMIELKGINIKEHPEDPIFKFLDSLFQLLPSTVSRCWTKFSQYFEFWYELSNKGKVLVQYMLNRQIIKHFMDYFLDNKSPLKIYVVKRQHSIGSSYASPNFTMLLKCVFSLLQQRMVLKASSNEQKKFLASDRDEQKLLISCESLEKLVSENYENIAAQLIKQICPNNILASEQAAFVILKGVSKATTQNINSYLELLHQFVLIEDEYQDLRIKWIIGKQTVAVSNISSKILGLNSQFLSERIHNYDSTINLESGSSLLEPIVTNFNKSYENYAILCLREVLRLCEVSKKLRKYICSLQSPNLIYSSFLHFLKCFVSKYNQQHKSYGYYTSSASFNRDQIGKEVKTLLQKITNLKEMDCNEEEEKKAKEKTQKQIAEVKPVEGGQIQPGEIKQIDADNQGNKQWNGIQFQEVKKKQSQSSMQNNADQTHSNGYAEDDTNYYSAVGHQQVHPENYYSTNYNIEDLDEEGWQKFEMDEQINEQKNKSPKRGNRPGKDKDKNNKINIKVTQSTRNKDTDEEDENTQCLVKRSGKKSNQKEKYRAEQIQDFVPTYMPVKFQYVPLKILDINPKLPNVKVQEHESKLIYVETKPNGNINRSFTSLGSSLKNYEKMNQDVWESQKIVKTHGFLIKNNSKEHVRIITDEGTVYCKYGDNLYVWANEILRVWECQRSFDWPKWSMFGGNK